MANDSISPSTLGPRTHESPATTLQLIDIGINLTHDSYDADRDAVLSRARAAGVVQMIVTGSSERSTQDALELARVHPGRLFATTGIHPHHATEATAQVLQHLETLARSSEVVAVGECGLDYFRDFSPRPVQRTVFGNQLGIAARTRKPVFLHQRDAHDDFLAILREHWRDLPGGVAHCFTGSGSQLDSYLELGLAIGITGWICDERRGAHLIPLMHQIPEDRLMLETDGPYLLPRNLDPKPGSRRNEPAYLPHIAAMVARARGETLEKVAASSTAAARKMFNLPDAAAAQALPLRPTAGAS